MNIYRKALIISVLKQNGREAEALKHLLTKTADFIRESDKILLIICTFASLYGCAAVFSATHYKATYRPVLIQFVCFAAGTVFALAISAVDYSKLLRRWYLAAAVGVVPVILTFFIGFAPEGTDDKAWLDLGFTTFQPAELLKICFIITFSAHLSTVKPNLNKPKYLIPVCAHGMFPVLLIHMQGDDGTALVFAVIMLFMLLAAGLSPKYFIVLVPLLAVLAPIIYFFVMNEDQRERLAPLFMIFDFKRFAGDSSAQWPTYQQWRGRTALANGGFAGQGFLNGDFTQSGIVPYGFNDFIFVSIGEELGFLGCAAVILVLGAICLRCLKVARLCRKDSGKLICVGVFAMIFTQTVINIGMCTSLLPVIGITLPFFSAGGTSLVCLYMGIGLVLSVYLHRNSRIIYLHDNLK